jgi:translation initiation factor IF-2
MSIRLIKISKDLNVGISSLVEFLHKKGFEIESNPNTKVDGEQHELLVREFGNNADLETLFDQRREKEEARNNPKEEVKQEPVVVEPEEIKTEIPEEIKPHVQIVDKIDLDALNKPKKLEKKEEPAKEETRIEPVIEVAKVVEVPEEIIPENKEEEDNTPVYNDTEEKVENEVITSIEEEKPEEEKSENEVFRLNKATIKSNIVVKGSIDLSTINDKTRPAKKTKAEKRKERLEKEQQDQKKVKENTVRLLKKETDEEAKKKKLDAESEEAKKKKRNRIKKGKVDIEKGAPAGAGGAQPRNNDKGKHTLRKPIVKQAVNEEDVQKQIKETLARLTTKGGK